MVLAWHTSHFGNEVHAKLFETFAIKHFRPKLLFAEDASKTLKVAVLKLNLYCCDFCGFTFDQPLTMIMSLRPNSEREDT